jgi:hypothetical protein
VSFRYVCEEKKINKQKERIMEVQKAVFVKFTKDQLIELGGEAAEAALEKTRLEIEFDAVKKDWKAQIEEQDNLLMGVLARIREGGEKVPATCIMEKDYKTGQVTFTRKDTGEVVEERDMTHDEKQMDIEEAA